ncbi:MAG: hypothetical protein EA361_10365, partial [Bacteroidetes bacterium]
DRRNRPLCHLSGGKSTKKNIVRNKKDTFLQKKYMNKVRSMLSVLYKGLLRVLKILNAVKMDNSLPLIVFFLLLTLCFHFIQVKESLYCFGQ